MGAGAVLLGATTAATRAWRLSRWYSAGGGAGGAASAAPPRLAPPATTTAFEVGTAKVDFTPAVPVWLSDYAARTAPASVSATGSSRIYARALALRSPFR